MVICIKPLKINEAPCRHFAWGFLDFLGPLSSFCHLCFFAFRIGKVGISNSESLVHLLIVILISWSERFVLMTERRLSHSLSHSGKWLLWQSRQYFHQELFRVLFQIQQASLYHSTNRVLLFSLYSFLQKKSQLSHTVHPLHLTC